MHRRARQEPSDGPRPAARIALALAILTLGATACTGTAAREPTVATTNFSPKLLLEVNEDGFVWKRGPRDDPSVSVPDGSAPPTVPIGTVMEVTNTGRREHWLDAGKTFDTGQIKPGDKTLIAFTETITEPKTAEIVDRDQPDHKTAVNLVPKPEPPS